MRRFQKEKGKSTTICTPALFVLVRKGKQSVPTKFAYFGFFVQSIFLGGGGISAKRISVFSQHILF